MYNHMVGRTASVMSPFYSLLPGVRTVMYALHCPVLRTMYTVLYCVLCTLSCTAYYAPCPVLRTMHTVLYCVL